MNLKESAIYFENGGYDVLPQATLRVAETHSSHSLPRSP
jgi:hypothetical protein